MVDSMKDRTDTSQLGSQLGVTSAAQASSDIGFCVEDFFRLVEQRLATIDARLSQIEWPNGPRIGAPVQPAPADLPVTVVELLADVRDTVARIEQDESQRYAALQANALAFTERLAALGGGNRDALARLEGGAERRFEALMAAQADALNALGPMGSGGRAALAVGRTITLDFRAETRALEPALAILAERASEEIVVLNAASELDGLARRSPSLRGNDWSGYIRLSELRFVRAAALLERRLPPGGRVLEFGSYFGGLSLMLARAGREVTAVDAYGEYSPALDRHVALMRAEGIDVVDFDRIGYDLAGLEPASFDAVCCMSVIEHVPHTPRLLLEAIDRVLKPGGTLVLDTPNLAYEYKRWDLASGRTVFAPLAEQYETDVPFAGHHREYTPGEVRWMMERIGYEAIELDTFCYSIYGMTTLTGEHAVRFEAMAADPDRRELIITAARKPAG
ncbi:MAG: class I SAM-dependent methyltransferase [Proteobacteria bacterium]|nr:class I SAM-dependent methyltransferase [Pseudomonadota bacterium]